MKNPTPLIVAALALAFSFAASAADLTLLEQGRSDYQIVTPDTSSTPEVATGVQQAARLIQAAFKASGADVPIVRESQRAAEKPAIYVGATAFAASHGVDVSQLTGWAYVQKVVGPDVIIAGVDRSWSVKLDGTERKSTVLFPRLGTLKAAADFVREYAGVRFLYPDTPSKASVDALGDVDLLNCAGVECVKRPAIRVPENLDVRRVPVLESNIGYPPRGGFYEIAGNRFPLFNTTMSTHTWGRAIPVSKYYDTHPEYFALQRGGKAGDGSRLKDDQYCISNPEVRELIYQDLVAHIQRGYDSVDLGQPDGFRPCQCDKCRELFGTGDDWSEKIWILHRQIAERLDREHPGKQVTIMSYILTANPPKSFKSFPKNVRIMLCGTNEEDIAPWRGIEVPRGFTCYLYNWCPNLTSNYTPMRTPRFVEEQARRLNRLHAQAIYRDGPGNLYGLEGPVFYTMNRMFDDPDHNTAAELVREFCDAAFGKAAAPMQSFYDQLYHAIDLEAEYLGTRCPGWTYHDIYGKRRKSLSDPFQLLGFLYTPSLMGSLERELSAAERQADHARAKQRLALVRREFDYLKHTVAVVHLYQAYQVAPDVSSRDRLLDAIDARNAHIATFFRGKTAPPMPGFAATLFPPSGHYPEHLRLAHDGYQGPFANTAFNWDTKLMRTLPPPGARKLSVPRVSGTMTIDSPQWSSVPAQPLAALPTDHRVKQATSVRVICDEANLYIRFEAELGGYVVRGNPPRRESDLSSGESFDIYLAPQPGREVYYRFMVAPNGAKFDAASGFITDAMDPRFGKDDPDWNGEWRYENRVADDRWTGLVTIPLKTMNATLSPGSSWRANFGRVHGQGKLIERSQWSAPIGAGNISDHAAMGELMFDQGK